MIRRTSKYPVKLAVKLAMMAALIGPASYANAGTIAVTPALAACSKALVETIAKSETLPAYKVKAPSAFFSETLDPNSFTVIARHGKTNALLAKASCRATPAGEIVSFKSIPLKS